MKRNWEYKKLTDVCSIQYGYPFESGNFTNEANGMPLIRIRDVKDGRTETYYEGPYPAEYIVHKGEYLIGMDGEFNIAPWKSDDALLNQRVCKITAKEGVFVGFLYRFLIKELKRIEDETPFVTVKHLSAKRLNQVTLPVPPLSEQSRIVAELDLLTGIIDKQNTQLKELDNLAQAIFYDMFGDPIENPKSWAFEKLENVCSNIVDCPHSTPKKVDYKTEYPCIRTSELKGGSISWTSMQYLEKEEYEIRIARLKPVAGDIVFGREGSIGDAVILPEGYNFSLGQRTMLLRANSALMLNHFLHSTLMSEWVKRQIDAVNVSSTVAHLNIKDFRQFNIPLPPLALQQSFAEKIQSIEKQKETIRASIADTQKLLDYTMDKYFG